jgi:hypothetical protein
LAALGVLAMLLALAVHPATAAVVVAAASVLLPVALFGFVLIPLALGVVDAREARVAGPVLVRARLFQRPPPMSLR